MTKIIISNKIVNFNHEDFPMLISGLTSAGSSLFSIELMVDLFKKGEKIILFSAYEQAKELFKKEMKDSFGNENALIIESGNDNLFIEQLNNIQDLSKRIILFKNIDNYDSKLFDKLKNNKLIIFSGNLDECKFKDELLKMEFKTKIYFSYPLGIKIENKIELPKYNGHIFSDKYNGIIKLIE